MKKSNLEFSELKLAADKILIKNFVEPITQNVSCKCDTCGVQAYSIYDYVDGYNHNRRICGACALINTPFSDGNFRINNLTKGLMILDPERLSITIITNSVNINKIDTRRPSNIEFVESNDDIYACLAKTVANSKSLSKKRYVIELGKRMHQYIHLAKISFDDHLYVATENKSLHINIGLIEHIVELQNLFNIEDIINAVKMQVGYLDKPTLRAYLSVIKEVLKKT